MKTIGRLFGVLAMLGLLLSIIGKSNGGMVICVVAIFFGLIRLIIGGGLI